MVAELDLNLIIERVRAGLRRARLEGRTLGHKPIEIDRVGLLRDRRPRAESAPTGQGLQNLMDQRREGFETVP
jgi:DNA invertase Pin-like site-specific DNA recombinase